MKENIKNELNRLSVMLKSNDNQSQLLSFLNTRSELKERLGIVTYKELASCLSRENYIPRKTVMKHFHINPRGIYWEDADMGADSDKQVTRQQLLERVSRASA